MKTKYLIFIALFFGFTFKSYSYQKRDSSLNVALVLSGGGAKGAAHIGVLKFLDELGIKVDYVVGTSMGAVVGGIYSIGYNATELDSIIVNQNWSMLMSDKVRREYVVYRDKELEDKTLLDIAIKSDKNKSLKRRLPSGVITGENVYNMLSMLSVGFQSDTLFSKLPIPFACVATDIVTGDYVVLDKGLLPLAMRASMSIPEVFTPVHYNNIVLVDGGVANNFPVNVAIEKGADFIIGVDVQSQLASKSQIGSVTSVMGQLIGLMGNDLYLDNVKKTDILISPNVSDFTTFSFNKEDIEALIKNGYDAALLKKDELLKLKAEIDARKEEKIVDIFNQSVYISDVVCEGINESEREWALKRTKLAKDMYVDNKILNRAVGELYGTGVFAYVTFNIIDSLGKNILKLNFKKSKSTNYGFGLRYDTEEAISLFVSVRLNEPKLFGSRYNILGALSINPYAQVGYSYASQNFAQLNVDYRFSYTDMNIYKRKRTEDNLTYIYNGISLSLSTNNCRNYNISGGVRLEDFKLKNIINLSDYNEGFVTLNSRSTMSLFSDINVDNRDNAYFPTRGVVSKNSLAYYFKSFKAGFKPLGTVMVNVAGVISVNDRFVIEPSFYGRLVFGHKIPIVYANYMGGEKGSRYLAQQIPFVGLNNADVLDNTLFVAGVSLRQKIAKRNYVYLIGNYAINSHSVADIFKGNDYWGLGLKYSYDSKFGPLSVTTHWSDYHQKFGVYINLGYYF